jgi:spore maturation protein CgeB
VTARGQRGIAGGREAVVTRDGGDGRGRERPLSTAFFYQSLVSDWNHRAAHFLRGIVSELISRGHRVRVFEPRHGWSRTNLVANEGDGPVFAFRRAYPALSSTSYDPARVALDRMLDGVDLAVVHDWSPPELIQRIGRHRTLHGGPVLLFHDTHQRAPVDAAAVAPFDLQGFDGILATGEALRRRYVDAGWSRRAWTWHEAADTRVFRPMPDETCEGGVVFFGRWGGRERDRELHDYLLRPVRELGTSGRAYGAQYPPTAREALGAAGIESCGYLPNFAVPHALARFRASVNVPRRRYARALPGVPAMRVFEALACGMPLVSGPWDDTERLFRPGQDFLVARDPDEMVDLLGAVLEDPDLARSLALSGLETIHSRHTCLHRIDQLLAIAAGLAPAARRSDFLGRAG